MTHLSDLKKQRILQHLKKGASYQQAAQTERVSIMTARLIGIQNGIRRTRHTLTRQQRLDIINDHQNGCSINRIAKDHHVSTATVSRILNQGADHRTRGADRDLILQAITEQGLTYKEAALQYDVSVSFIRNVLAENGITIGYRTPIPKELIPDILEDRRMGMTVIELAEKYGYNINTIARAIRNGEQTRRR